MPYIEKFYTGSAEVLDAAVIVWSELLGEDKVGAAGKVSVDCVTVIYRNTFQLTIPEGLTECEAPVPTVFDPSNQTV